MFLTHLWHNLLRCKNCEAWWVRAPYGHEKPPILSSLIIWLSIQRKHSKGWSYYRLSVTTQMVSQADRLMGIRVVFIAEVADDDTIAQVVKCTPLIVLHQADEITLFKEHPACPCSAGAFRRWHVLFFSPQPPTHTPTLCPWCISQQVCFRQSRRGLSPWQQARSTDRKTRSASDPC